MGQGVVKGLEFRGFRVLEVGWVVELELDPRRWGYASSRPRTWTFHIGLQRKHACSDRLTRQTAQIQKGDNFKP